MGNHLCRAGPLLVLDVAEIGLQSLLLLHYILLDVNAPSRSPLPRKPVPHA